MRPRLLDLFCGAGGSAMGYHRAGFDVVGVDIKPQPNYPFEFVEADALEHTARWLEALEQLGKPASWDFDAIHASPPCPRYSSITRVHGRQDEHPDLVAPVRELLIATGLPYVIENVPGSPLFDYAVLCGSSLGLGANCVDGKWRQLRRHRWFETTVSLMAPSCVHQGEPVGVYGHGGGQRKTVWNGGVNRGYMANRAEACEALGIDWMTKAELSDAVPPAYTELIGAQLLAQLHRPAPAPAKPSREAGLSASPQC